MIFYSRHTEEACFYYRISQKPGDITTLGEEKRMETDHNTTYPSPFILTDDPGHIYLCSRNCLMQVRAMLVEINWQRPTAGSGLGEAPAESGMHRRNC
ncbi:BNR-4 repeat-containing protein [Sphingobacterium micropteri]|uniref:BNR-4 repeat-containing protein n=1 Tax=Sphingobacterium micropteri TaxID=2763501 RepID=UPI001CC28C1B|nr:BNR-4 repeat-containing protein [Sphingobacterium micropteri]